ncbi:MAG: class I SAM-dependent methyltransferase [Hyphomicrobiaceae bacterium]|nr:class I SAM-dependent methyltransferase [Hyphomicrobiaceae bacterium]
MPTSPHSIEVITTPGASGYALLDSGGGRKLERFGAVVVDRPEPQALWRRSRSDAEWTMAHAVFSASGEDDEKGKWRVDRPVPDEWPVAVDADGAVTVGCRLSGLWHLGLFPEQRPHWQFMLDHLKRHGGRDGPPRVLNLFGYTGAASLLAAHAGADVTHVDASKKAVAWGKDNQAGSGLSGAKIRWIVDDALKFAAREVRRGKTYDVVLLDPPKFGRGPEGEVFDLYRHICPLMEDCAKLLAPGPSAMVLTVYAIRASALAFAGLVAETLTGRSGHTTAGELALTERDGGRLLPTSLFVRWTGEAG